MADNSPEVSIIMNCYNGEEFLEQAIQSVINQSFTNWEIIFWDNLSQDQSKIIFKSFDDARLKYHLADTHTPLYEARNFAIKKSKGQYLAFLDVDDYWEHNKLEKQLPLFNNSKVGFVCSNYLIQHELKRKSWIAFKKEIPSGFVTDELLSSYFIGLLTLMIRKEAYDSLHYGFDPKFSVMGDLDITTRLSLDWQLGSIQEVLAVCRKHGNNILVQEREKHINEMKYWIERMDRLDSIRTRSSFHKLEDNLSYQKFIHHKLQNNLKQAFKELSSISLGMKKIRSLIIFLIPLRLLKLLKND